jgi:predicted TIM-barrel fold metal-dependent hydrolase
VVRRSAFLDDTARRQILHGNAETFLGIDPIADGALR